MKRKGLLKKALSCVLSVAVACSVTVFVPQTAKAAGESWNKNIFIDFGTANSNLHDISGTNMYSYFSDQLGDVTEIQGFGSMLYDTNDISKDSSGQNVGFTSAVPAGFTGKSEVGGNYFQDWVFGKNGEPYTFKADLPAGQYVVYVYSGNKTSNSVQNSGNVTKFYFGDEVNTVYNHSSAGGSQFYGSSNSYPSWQENEGAFEVTVKDSGDGTGTLSLTVFDDTIEDSENGKVSRLPDGNFYCTVDYDGFKAAMDGGNEDYMNVQAIDTNGVDLTGSVISARMNGIEIAYLKDAVATTKVTASPTLSVEAGKTAKVSASTEPENSTERVYYISEDKSVATVDPLTGEVTGIAPGKTKIKTCSGDFSAETEVTVSKSYASSLDKTSSSLTIIPHADVMAEYGMDEVTLTFEADNLEDAQKAFSVKAEDTSIVDVAAGDATASGTEGTFQQVFTLTAKDKGNTNVVFTRNTGTELKCAVSVKKAAYGIEWDESVDQSGLVFDINDTDDHSVLAKVLPEDASNTGVTYTSSDKSVITVGASTGKLSIKGVGEAVITATSKDGGFEKTVGVKVVKSATGLTLDASAKSMTVGETATLNATVTEADSTDSLEWSSDNEKIVTVDQSGKITAVSEGTAVITVRTVSELPGKEQTANCSVTVTKKSEAPTLTPTPTPTDNNNNSGKDTGKKKTAKATLKISGKKTVKKGKKITLTAKTKNTTKKVKWKIKDAKSKKVIKITKKNAAKKTAEIKGLKKGKGTVVVTCGTLKKTVTITVKK